MASGLAGNAVSTLDIERKRWRREKRRAILGQPCPVEFCAAQPGQPCRNRAGLVIGYCFHTRRQDAGFRAWQEIP
jgi:hypothetical protein